MMSACIDTVRGEELQNFKRSLYKLFMSSSRVEDLLNYLVLDDPANEFVLLYCLSLVHPVIPRVFF